MKLEFVIDRRSGRRRRGVLERTRDEHVEATNGMKADGRVSRPCLDQRRGFSQGYADATVAGGRSAMGEGARVARTRSPSVSTSLGVRGCLCQTKDKPCRPSRILHRPVPAALARRFAQGPESKPPYWIVG